MDKTRSQTTRITSANKNAADTLNYKGQAEDGVLFLDSTTASASGLFHGFVVGDNSVTIDSITWSNVHEEVGDILTYEWNPGGYFPLPEFTDITISAGSLMLCKHEPRNQG